MGLIRDLKNPDPFFMQQAAGWLSQIPGAICGETAMEGMLHQRS